MISENCSNQCETKVMISLFRKSKQCFLWSSITHMCTQIKVKVFALLIYIFSLNAQVKITLMTLLQKQSKENPHF